MSRRFWTTVATTAALVTVGSVAQAQPAPTTTWTVVANNGDTIPGSQKQFNSYNQPSINLNGAVVFRARSKGGDGGAVRGIYLWAPRSGLSRVTAVGSTVPDPNNTEATFLEFPAFPRIDLESMAVVTRGQTQPVWEYTLPDDSDTRVGTSGVYATVDGNLRSAATLLGNVPGFEVYEVPGAPDGTRFDQFPGAPAISAGGVTVFKGNYTDGLTSKTGIFYRDVRFAPDPIRRIASSDTTIPGHDVTFGSTAPPSAAGRTAVFLGVDNEASPTVGGIYSAPIASDPALKLLVGIGSTVPGHTEADRFSKLGEALSFDGRYTAFWGAWGDETRDITLQCPTDGNAALLAYCNSQYPTGYIATVPVHQGIFVHDSRTNVTTQVAETGTLYQDFLYWSFSGRAPGSGGGDDATLELARWRSASFAAVGAGGGQAFAVAFKARTVTGTDGIFARAGSTEAQTTTVIDTTTSGTAVDPEAPEGSRVTAVGIERDGFRNGRLALTASMFNAETGLSWAGVYVTKPALGK